MADTIHPDAPVPAIAAASTPRDIIRAASADPALANALTGLVTTDDPKALLASRTFWAAILTPVVSGAVMHFGLAWDPATIASVTTLLEMVAMVAMRFVTRAPVTGVVKS